MFYQSTCNTNDKVDESINTKMCVYFKSHIIFFSFNINIVNVIYVDEIINMNRISYLFYLKFELNEQECLSETKRLDIDFAIGIPIDYSMRILLMVIYQSHTRVRER
jgi:hypothetical protein